jgi:hypothetical protein
MNGASGQYLPIRAKLSKLNSNVRHFHLFAFFAAIHSRRFALPIRVHSRSLFVSFRGPLEIITNMSPISASLV